MQKARNHVTQIIPTDTVAKGTEEVEQKATGETKAPDPQNAKEIIQKNTGKKITVGPNTTLDKEELEGPTGEEAEAVKQEQKENQEKAEETTLKQGDIVDLSKGKGQQKK